MRPYARPGQRQRTGRSPFVRADDSSIYTENGGLEPCALAGWMGVEHVKLAIVASRLYVCLYVCVVRVFDRRRQHSRAIEGRRPWLVIETREAVIVRSALSRANC